MGYLQHVILEFNVYVFQELALGDMGSKVGTISDQDGVTQLIVSTLNDTHSKLK